MHGGKMKAMPRQPMPHEEMDKCDEVQDTRRPLVNESLDRMTLQIKSLRETADTLFKRLGPVMRNEPCGEACDKDKEKPSSCVLADNLDVLTSQLSGIAETLGGALHCLEI